MWKQKLGISLRDHYGIPMEDVLRMLKEIGFDAVSPVWRGHLELQKTVEAARNLGLEIQSLHAPNVGMAYLWEGTPEEAEKAKREILEVAEACRCFRIPVMVMHVWFDFGYHFRTTKQGLECFTEIVETAEQYGIQIAFENAEGEEYLCALMEYFKDKANVGFCWDSGHEMCYNHSRDWLKEFGDRLCMTHLHDNLGISRFDGQPACEDDLHLLPYDGVADWEDNIARLRKAKKQEYLNFELSFESKPNRHENDVYKRMDLRLYFTEAYKRACRIGYKYSI